MANQYLRIPLAGGSGGAAWGAITGTLSDQTDLQTALNLKATLASPTFTGTVSVPVGSSGTPSILIGTGQDAPAKLFYDTGTLSLRAVLGSGQISLLANGNNDISAIAGAMTMDAPTGLFLKYNTTAQLSTATYGVLINNLLRVDGGVYLGAIATPSTPSANYVKLYNKTDSLMYVINSAGTEKQLAFTDSPDTFDYSTPTAGQTVTMTKKIAVINPAGTLATLTVTLPASPVDGQRARFGCSQVITALTVNAGAATVSAAPSSLAVGDSAEFIYRTTGTTWYRIG